MNAVNPSWAAEQIQCAVAEHSDLLMRRRHNLRAWLSVEVPECTPVNRQLIAVDTSARAGMKTEI